MTYARLALWLLAPLTLLTLLFSSQLYVVYRSEGVPFPFRGILLLQMGHWYLWAIAGPVAWACATRWPLRSPGRGQTIARHLAIAAAVSLAVVGGYVALTYTLVRL